MTEIEKLQNVIDLIKDHGVKVRIRVNADRFDPFPNGVCDFIANEIRIYCSDKLDQAGLINTMLVHEFGHWVAQKEIGPHHSERQAWTIGKRQFARSWISEEYYWFRDFNLDVNKMYRKRRP